MSISHTLFHGRLVREPELSYTSSNIAYCKFTLAVDRDYTPKGEEKKADFPNCVIWRGGAETIAKYFTKGSEIVVSGRFESNNYEDKDGNKRTSWTLNVDRFDFCGNKQSNNQETATVNAPTTAPEPVPAKQNDEFEEFIQVDFDDDLPF